MFPVNSVSDTCLAIGVFVVSGIELMYVFGTPMQCPASMEPAVCIWSCNLHKTRLVSKTLALEAGTFGSSISSRTIACFAVLMRDHSKPPNVAAKASTACLKPCCRDCRILDRPKAILNYLGC